MSRLTLTLHDFVNFQIEGLDNREIGKIQSKTSLMVKGCFVTAAYKAKIWDGRESLFNDEGFGLIYELNKVLDILEGMGYDLDEDITLVDLRPDIPFPSELVAPDLLKEFVGHDLYDYQVNAINSAILEQQGILDIGTNGGKSLICVGISKVFEPYMKSIVVVPSEKLANQTEKDYIRCELNAIALTKKIKPKDRQSKINEHKHIIITSKLFLNCAEFFEDQTYAILYDETHIFGEATADIMRIHMGHCPIRIGMSATMPLVKSDPYKRNMICAYIGGGVLGKVEQKTLIKRGISSKLNIRMVSTRDPAMEALCRDKSFVWESEDSYLNSNRVRVEAIADFIQTLPPMNTLILCHAGLGSLLAEELDLSFIFDETPTELRDEWFSRFGVEDDYSLIGTFGTVATGISENRIFRLIMIDVGKNRTYILQGIGRALRLDGVIDSVEAIDISAETKYSKIHKKERIAIYKAEEFPYVEDVQPIMVLNEEY